MSQRTLKKIQYNGSDVIVEAAIRDGSGNTITSTYATKSEVSTGLSGKQNSLTAGTGIDITNSTISVVQAATNALGGIKIGTGLSIDASTGAVSVTSAGSVEWSNVANKPFSSVSTGTGGDFVISSNTLTISDSKFATKSFVADTYVALSAYNTLVNTTLPATYQSKITNDNKLAYSLLSGVPTTVSTFTNDANYITNSTQGLSYYYKKTETYTKSEIEALINAVNSFEYVIVSELPALEDADDYESYRNKIYLIPSANSRTQNAKDEYIAIRSGSVGSYTYSWEQIGTTSVDLTNYLNSDANITNNVIVVGDGGTRKVKGSGYTIATSVSNSDTSIPRSSAIYSALSGKQATLTSSNAGTGISITDGVISSVISVTDVTLDY